VPYMYKHLVTLLKKSSILGIFIILNLSFLVQAESDNEISILSNTQTIYERQTELSVDLFFSDLSYYNDQCYLSYHVWDADHNMLQYENARIPIKLDKNGEGNIAVQVNLSGLKGKCFYITFDIVDEKNQFWFSDNSNIEMNSVEVECVLNGIKRIVVLVNNEVKSSPIIFGINFLCFVVSFFMLYKIKKSWE